MQLNNTIILPAENPNSAKSLLSSHMAKTDILTVVIFGKDSLAEKTVEMADIRADGTVADIGRKVVWMMNTGMLPFLKSLISDGPDFKIESIDTDKHIGIALSMDKILLDVIPKDPEPDFIRMELAFINAGTQ